MLRIYFYLILGVVPLSAQDALNRENKVNPAQPPGNAVMTPGLNAPPPGTPLPVVPPQASLLTVTPRLPHITGIVFSPGTVREGLTDKTAVKTTVTLSAPATKDLLCHVVSSDPNKVVCGNIVVMKGHQQEDGAVEIRWKAVFHNCQVQIKAFDDENPEALLSTRVYLRKKIE